MNFQTVFVNSREVVALHFNVIKFIKAQEVIKVNNLIVFREDVVRRLYMANMNVTLLLSHHKHADLDPLFLSRVYSRSQRRFSGGLDGGPLPQGRLVPEVFQD